MVDVLVIGLGRISFSLTRNKTICKSSHIGTLLSNKKYNLIGAVDKSISKINYVKRHVKTKFFTNIKEALKKLKPNLIVIAVSTDNHLKIITYLKKINFICKVILIEKPLGRNFFEAKKIINILKSRNIKIFVNYSRNYEPKFASIKKIFNNKENIGFVLYSGDFLNNASHFISLFVHFFGKVRKIKLLNYKNNNNNINIDCILYFQKCILYIFNFKKRKTHIFLLKDRNKILFCHNLLNKIHILNNKKKKIINTNLQNHNNVYDEIYKYINNKKFIISSTSDALYVHKIIRIIMKKNKDVNKFQKV
jgi:predicted dehydrogenase